MSTSLCINLDLISLQMANKAANFRTGMETDGSVEFLQGELVGNEEGNDQCSAIW